MLRAFLKPFLRRLPMPGLFMNPFRRRFHGRHQRHHHRRQVMPSRVALGQTFFSSRGGEQLEHRQLLAFTTDSDPIGTAALVSMPLASLVSGIALASSADAVATVGGAGQQVVASDDSSLNASARSAWADAVASTNQLLAALPTRTDYASLMQDVFGKVGTDATAFSANVDAVAGQLSGAGLGIAVEFLSNDVMQGAIGSYAAVGPDGTERIYLNSDWLNGNVTADAVKHAVLHEIGHAIVLLLNVCVDSPGEEG